MSISSDNLHLLLVNSDEEIKEEGQSEGEYNGKENGLLKLSINSIMGFTSRSF